MSFESLQKFKYKEILLKGMELNCLQKCKTERVFISLLSELYVAVSTGPLPLSLDGQSSFLLRSSRFLVKNDAGLMFASQHKSPQV